MGRFTERGADSDMTAALFHEQYAADLGVKEAMVTLASIFFGLTHEILVNVSLEASFDCFKLFMYLYNYLKLHNISALKFIYITSYT